MDANLKTENYIKIIKKLNIDNELLIDNFDNFVYSLLTKI